MRIPRKPLSRDASLHRGRYTNLRFVGEGGFGLTYEAWDTALACSCAVKEFFLSPGDNSELLVARAQDGMSISVLDDNMLPIYKAEMERSRREFEILRCLDHPNIVRLYDVFEENNTLYAVLDWLGGGSLQTLIDEGKEVDAATSLGWMNLLLDALGYMHKLNVFHRDLKPSNIMFNADGSPIIIDFGAALDRKWNKRHGVVTTNRHFTRYYRAPEQKNPELGKIGAWTDLYAFSVMWQDFLTGDALRSRSVPLTPEECIGGGRDYPPQVFQALWQACRTKIEQRCQSVEDWRRIQSEIAP